MNQTKKTAAETVAAADPWVSRAEIAKRYNVSYMCVYHWMRSGKIPQPVRLSSRCLRWRLSEVIAAIEGESAATGAAR
jgi:predicted DNA-binding transcriptional regulator AlpA